LGAKSSALRENMLRGLGDLRKARSSGAGTLPTLASCAFEEAMNGILGRSDDMEAGLS
jgi:hypothetical protein